jgi:adenosylcobinamide kinase/adenosylcobinamide-phosphate guanylyltransferase
METVGLDAIEDLMRRETTALLGVVRQRHEARWILVSNEVGLGIVPDNAVARAFRDALGRVNQMVAAAADEVSLMVAGVEMRVK